jgi:peptidoglycan/LPS O-acetylase OafA/YrhL
MHKDNFMRWSVPVACMAGCGFMGVNANITQSYFLDPLTGTLGASLAALTFASLIVIATDAESGLARMLSFPPLVCVGRWSYAMYLAHFVVFKFSEGALKSWAAHQSATVSTLTKLGYFPFLALATTAIGALSWVLIERPLERIKSRLVYTFTAA